MSFFVSIFSADYQASGTLDLHVYADTFVTQVSVGSSQNNFAKKQSIGIDFVM